MPFNFSVNLAQTDTTAADMQANEFAVVDSNNPNNPSTLLGHLLFCTGGANGLPQYIDLSDLAQAIDGANTFVDILADGAALNITITSTTPTQQTWQVAIPEGMTIQQAMQWVSQFAAPYTALSVIPSYPNLLVSSAIGTFNCPGAILVSIG